MTEAPILLPEAKEDVADAYQWYEEQSLGLGMDFLRCIEATLVSMPAKVRHGFAPGDL
mgnify:CR=1 FL=1